MEALETLKTRRSVRKYKSDMIPKDIIEKIIEAGTYAPTGMNRQTPIIIVVTNKKVRDKLSKLNASFMEFENDPFYNAHAAKACGISSCWIHRAKEEFETEEGKQILKELGIEGDFEGIGHCILGYADDDEPAPAPRKDNYVYWIE